jgi:hypothetical protein
LAAERVIIHEACDGFASPSGLIRENPDLERQPRFCPAQ